VDNCSISGGEHTGTGLKTSADGINSAVKSAECQGFSALIVTAGRPEDLQDFQIELLLLLRSISDVVAIEMPASELKSQNVRRLWLPVKLFRSELIFNVIVT
jgi:hypothetical protein